MKSADQASAFDRDSHAPSVCRLKRCSPQSTAALLVSAAILSAVPTNAAFSGQLQADLAPLTRQLAKLGHNLCYSLKLECHTTTAPSQKKSRPRRAVKSIVQHPLSQTTKTGTASTSVDITPKHDVGSAKSVNPPKSLIPIPRSKPSLNIPQQTAAEAVVAVPKSKPDQIKATVPALKEETFEIATRELPPSFPGDDCLASLRSSKVNFEVMVAPVSSENCHVDKPVRLHAIPTTAGTVVLPDSPILNCRFARQFSLWLSDTGAAVVFSHLNKNLAKVSTGPGYQCRGRNGDASAKLSEHASGNAVDITTMTTADGQTVQVSDAINSASPSFQVLRGLRATACGYFSTVLGPGTNQAHASHFHFDMAMHGKSQNYRICE